MVTNVAPTDRKVFRTAGKGPPTGRATMNESAVVVGGTIADAPPRTTKPLLGAAPAPASARSS